MLLPALAAREVGSLRGPRLASKAVGDPGLALRLCEVADLNLEDRGGVGALAWNGTVADSLAVGHDDGRLVLWQPETGTHSEIDTVSAWRWNGGVPLSRWMAACGLPGAPVTDPALANPSRCHPSLFLLCQGHTGPMHGLSFLPDGTILSAAGDGQVRMHSLRRGATRPFHLHSAAATSVLAVEQGVGAHQADTSGLWGFGVPCSVSHALCGDGSAPFPDPTHLAGPLAPQPPFFRLASTVQ